MHFRSFMYGIAACAALGTAVAVAQNKSFDDLVVANVNGEEITRRQLVARLLEYQGEDALQKMVNRSLLLQSAKQRKITVTDKDVTDRVEEIRKQFKKPAEFETFLSRSNLTEKQYRDEVRYTALLQKVALDEAPVKDEDLQQYDVRMIVTSKQKDAEQWIKELENGADFGQMATNRTEDPSGRKAGGRMRPFTKIELLDVWRAIDEQKLKPGGFTKKPVLLTDSSWALIKLENIVPKSKASAAELDRLTALITRYRMDQWLNQTRTKAKIGYPVPISAVLLDNTATAKS
jgi:foldase protein PrsA